MYILAYDTETTGLPDWKQPSESEHQPHLVDLAGILYDEAGNEVDSFETIIRPDGWEIPEEVSAIHGITQERALDEGIPEDEAVAEFLELHKCAILRVAHNESFDARILRIAIKRYGPGDTQEARDAVADAFKAGPSYCTCNKAKPIMRLPATPKMVKCGRGSWFKPPNLQEAHQHFLGEPFEGAHRARADAQACARIYFAMQQAPAKQTADTEAAS